MSGRSPSFSYTCELCGAEGLGEGAMREHTLSRHVRGRPACPFCDLPATSGLPAHVTQTHLHYLTPDDELMTFIDEHTPGYSEDAKKLPQNCSYSNSDSIHNGWHTPDSIGVSNGAVPKSNKKNVTKAQIYYNGYSDSSIKNGAKSKKCGDNFQTTDKLNLQRDYRNSSGSLCDNANSSGAKSRNKKSKSTTRENSSERQTEFTNGSLNKIDHYSSGNNSGSDYEISLSPAGSKGSLSSAGQGSPLRSQLALKLKANAPKNIVPTPSPTIQCLMCQFTSTCPQKLEEHMNRAHFDLTSPSLVECTSENGTNSTANLTNATIGLTNANAALMAEEEVAGGSTFSCPICQQHFTNGSEVELHVNIDHKDILSPQKAEGADKAQACGSSPVTSPAPGACPVCGLLLPQPSTHQDLMEHIEEHFENGDEEVSEERRAQKQREDRDFHMLRVQYGMEEEEEEGEAEAGAGRGYAGRAAQGLRRAVCSGQLSVADYYEQRVGLRRAEAEGVDDGATCTTGLLPKILSLNSQSNTIARTYLCSAVDHYASSHGDRGWGCGYRNMQMLMSSLLRHTGYGARLPQGAVPSVPRLQLMVERAWQMGFDLQGSEQLGCKLYNTRKWIGACEVVTVLSSLKIRCQLVDFHRPTSPDGGHPELFRWVLRYFKDNSSDFKPPLYLQHQGHSRTIIGIEQSRDSKYVLLVLDPSHSPAQVRAVLCGGAGGGGGAAMRGLRRGESALRARQYQLVAVTGLFETETEYKASKILQSIRIPQDR